MVLYMQTNIFIIKTQIEIMYRTLCFTDINISTQMYVDIDEDIFRDILRKEIER